MKFDKCAFLWCFQNKKLVCFSNKKTIFNIYEDILFLSLLKNLSMQNLSISLYFSLYHSNKLDHFTSIGKTWCKRRFSPPLGQRSRNLKNPFPSSLTPTLVRPHTTSGAYEAPEWVFHTHSLTPLCMNTNALGCGLCVQTQLSSKLWGQKISNSLLWLKGGE